MATRMLVVAASMVGVTLLSSVDAAPVLGRAAPSPPGGRNTDGGPGMGENYTCSDQYSGQFGHSPCVLPALRRAATSLLSLSGALGCDLELRAHHAQWSFVLCVPGIARELSQLALLPLLPLLQQVVVLPAREVLVVQGSQSDAVQPDHRQTCPRHWRDNHLQAE